MPRLNAIRMQQVRIKYHETAVKHARDNRKARHCAGYRGSKHQYDPDLGRLLLHFLRKRFDFRFQQAVSRNEVIILRRDVIAFFFS